MERMHLKLWPFVITPRHAYYVMFAQRPRRSKRDCILARIKHLKLHCVPLTQQLALLSHVCPATACVAAEPLDTCFADGDSGRTTELGRWSQIKAARIYIDQSAAVCAFLNVDIPAHLLTMAARLAWNFFSPPLTSLWPLPWSSYLLLSGFSLLSPASRPLPHGGLFTLSLCELASFESAVRGPPTCSRRPGRKWARRFGPFGPIKFPSDRDWRGGRAQQPHAPVGEGGGGNSQVRGQKPESPPSHKVGL